MISACSLLAGVLAGLGFAAMPGGAWLWCAGVLSIATLATPLRQRRVPRMLALLLLGMAHACAASQRWLELRVHPAGDDERVLLEGQILTVPARNGLELRFDADVRVIAGAAAHDALPRRARLLWREAATPPRVGERWRLLVRLMPLADTQNFRGADPARLAFRDRVHLPGRVLPSALNERQAIADDSIATARAGIATRIAELVVDRDAAALLTALAVGITDGMSADQWRVFNATGTTHLVAISGLHVTLFALLACGAARLLWRWLPLVRRIEREPFAWLLGLAAAGGYSLLAGLSVPTLRTWLMLCIFAAGRLAARRASFGRVWSMALIAVLLFDPFAPLSAGFWLSFVAVGVIALIESTTLTPVSRVFGALRLQLAVTLALAPLTLAVFAGVSLAGVWVNLAAIPIISFVLVPLVLAGALTVWIAPVASPTLFGLAATLHEWLWPALSFAADGPLSLWRVVPPLWWYAFALLAVLPLLRSWPLPLRLSAACAVLPLLYSPTRMPAIGNATLSVFDAGRGSSVLLATHSHVLLFDTGDSWNTHGTRVRQLALPALDELAQSGVDLLVLPALNADRAEGAALLAEERGVSRIVVSGGWPGASLPVADCQDSRFSWDGIDFELFDAGAGRFCVLRVSAGTHAILLAGDLDAAGERGLLARLPPGTLASEVVFMSRQASSMGSTLEWIEATAPGLAIATGGIRESDSRARTLARWRAAGAEVLDTRRNGGIELGLGTNGAVLLGQAASARYPFIWRRLQ